MGAVSGTSLYIGADMQLGVVIVNELWIPECLAVCILSECMALIQGWGYGGH